MLIQKVAKEVVQLMMPTASDNGGNGIAVGTQKFFELIDELTDAHGSVWTEQELINEVKSVLRALKDGFYMYP